jgi:hypothetical protein
MRDFTLSIYEALLDGLQQARYGFQTFESYLQTPQRRVILLRHDVDDRNRHSLQFARIQHRRGICGTYYFRVVPQSFDPDIIREIADMGHEIGYHYEDMDFAGGDPHQAIRLFERHLEQLRRITPISTICMHGSPKSKYDNKDVWKHYNYRDYGIVGEPYFDLDFKTVFYGTDTGRRWDGDRVSVRDKAPKHFDLHFHGTDDLIRNIDAGGFPEQAMLTFHPQRWTNEYPLWLREKYLQAVKNTIKYYLIKLRNAS